jgi:hypothetical protein
MGYDIGRDGAFFILVWEDDMMMVDCKRICALACEKIGCAEPDSVQVTFVCSGPTTDGEGELFFAGDRVTLCESGEVIRCS